MTLYLRGVIIQPRRYIIDAEIKMAHPDWVLKCKQKNTEVRCIRGKYYLYGMTSKWDPEKRRNKKVTLGQIGVITQEYGLIPTGQMRKGRIPAGQSPFKTPPEKLSKETNFMDDLVQLDDTRSERNQWHSIAEILLAALCAVLCGADGWADMEMYAKIKIQFLQQYFPYIHGTPSDDTFRRFFRAVDIGQFEKNFRTWIGKLAKIDKPQIINIDGKCSKHSFDDEQKMLHLVNVFASESKIVLGQERVDEKSNEITALPKILEWLDVNGHIVTIDAMGCQYAVADKILKKGGNYVFSLKGNQATLSDDVELYFKKESMQKVLPFSQRNQEHGRIETRECWVENNVQWLRDMHENWSSIQSIVRIRSTREIKQNSGYSLELMSSLLENDEKNAVSGKIYLSIHGEYIVRDLIGVVNRGNLDINLIFDEKLVYNAKNLKKKKILESVLSVTSKAGHTRNISVEDRYYISSLRAETAKKMLENIRSHWAIENSLHWILDMSFFDDQSRIRKGNAPHAMAILRHVAYNLLQHVKREKQSIKSMRKMCGWDENFLEKVISQKSS